jgi:hypothetical protein
MTKNQQIVLPMPTTFSYILSFMAGAGIVLVSVLAASFMMRANNGALARSLTQYTPTSDLISTSNSTPSTCITQSAQSNSINGSTDPKTGLPFPITAGTVDSYNTETNTSNVYTTTNSTTSTVTGSYNTSNSNNKNSFDGNNSHDGNGNNDGNTVASGNTTNSGNTVASGNTTNSGNTVASNDGDGNNSNDGNASNDANGNTLGSNNGDSSTTANNDNNGSNNGSGNF